LANIDAQKNVKDLNLLCGKERPSEATKVSGAISHDSFSGGGERQTRAGLRNLDFYPVIEVSSSPTVIQWLCSARKLHNGQSF
jgi:hypothetical protein